MTRPYSIFKNKWNLLCVVQTVRRSTSKSTGSRSPLEAERIAMKWVVNGTSLQESTQKKRSLHL